MVHLCAASNRQLIAGRVCTVINVLSISHGRHLWRLSPKLLNVLIMRVLIGRLLNVTSDI